MYSNNSDAGNGDHQPSSGVDSGNNGKPAAATSVLLNPRSTATKQQQQRSSSTPKKQQPRRPPPLTLIPLPSPSSSSPSTSFGVTARTATNASSSSELVSLLSRQRPSTGDYHNNHTHICQQQQQPSGTGAGYAYSPAITTAVNANSGGLRMERLCLGGELVDVPGALVESEEVLRAVLKKSAFWSLSEPAREHLKVSIVGFSSSPTLTQPYSPFPSDFYPLRSRSLRKWKQRSTVRSPSTSASASARRSRNSRRSWPAAILVGRRIPRIRSNSVTTNACYTITTFATVR